MIVFICVLVYVAIELVTARVLYTKYDKGEIFYGEGLVEVCTGICAGSFFWPVLILGWMTWKFITGGARKK